MPVDVAEAAGVNPPRPVVRLVGQRCAGEIVPPGTTFTLADSGWTPPAVADPALRRR
jgi:hypothetical protein